jgi:hypothetical protein
MCAQFESDFSYQYATSIFGVEEDSIILAFVLSHYLGRDVCHLITVTTVWVACCLHLHGTTKFELDVTRILTPSLRVLARTNQVPVPNAHFISRSTVYSSFPKSWSLAAAQNI